MLVILSEDVKEARTRKAVLIGLVFVCGTWLGAGKASGFPIASPAALNTNAGTDSGGDYYPTVATDKKGNWVAVWQSNDGLGGTLGPDFDIAVARSTDDGATWTAPTALNTNAASDTDSDYFPHVTADGAGNVLVVWFTAPTEDDPVEIDGDILYARSTNNGATWTAPAALNTNAASDTGSDASPRATTDGNGTWLAVWSSNENLGGGIGADGDILFSRSTDNGVTWAAPAALNSYAATDTGEEWNPQVATDGLGNAVAVWTSNDDQGGTLGTDVDVLFARSTDNGATWPAAGALNTNAATDSGHDNFPQLATDRSGNWIAVWQSDDDLGGTIGNDDDILVCRSVDHGVTWTAPASLNATATSDNATDKHPHVTTDTTGNWVVVWEFEDPSGLGTIFGADEDILWSMSTDRGATWTIPLPLNTNATSDAGADRWPYLATDELTHWVVTWQSTEELGGTIGNDRDILTTPMVLSFDCGTGICGVGTGALLPFMLVGMRLMRRHAPRYRQPAA